MADVKPRAGIKPRAGMLGAMQDPGRSPDTPFEAALAAHGAGPSAHPAFLSSP